MAMAMAMAMASMLLRRASRDALRAAPSAALVASASTRPLRSFPISSRYYGRRRASNRDFLVGPEPATPVRKVDFVVDDAKDLASDEALWALYERWGKAFGEKRSQKEMRRRFNEFKDTVLFVDREIKEAIRDGRTPSVGINKFTDGKLWEQMAPRNVSYNQMFGHCAANQQCSDPGKPESQVDDVRDLKSWELTFETYKRWSQAFGEERDEDEMRASFNDKMYSR